MLSVKSRFRDHVEAEDPLSNDLTLDLRTYIAFYKLAYLSLYNFCLPQQALVNCQPLQPSLTFSDPISFCISISLGPDYEIVMVMSYIPALILHIREGADGQPCRRFCQVAKCDVRFSFPYHQVYYYQRLKGSCPC